MPEGILGRAASVNQIFIGSSNEIGAFKSGIAITLMWVVAVASSARLCVG